MTDKNALKSSLSLQRARRKKGCEAVHSSKTQCKAGELAGATPIFYGKNVEMKAVQVLVTLRIPEVLVSLRAKTNVFARSKAEKNCVTFDFKSLSSMAVCSIVACCFVRGLHCWATVHDNGIMTQHRVRVGNFILIHSDCSSMAGVSHYGVLLISRTGSVQRIDRSNTRSRVKRTNNLYPVHLLIVSQLLSRRLAFL